MSLSTIRAAIKTELESISNVGKVQDYRRHHIDWDKIVASFVDDGKVNAWIIEWRDAVGTEIAGQSSVIERRHTFRLFGLYSLKDLTASAKTFEGITEEVMDQFDKLDNNILTAGVKWFAPARLQSVDEGLFAGILCHRAEVILSFSERIVP
jgi:hypothetical protein